MHFTIVSYTFPPSKEIGGRRWAKFSQYLSRMGHEVTVICADNSAAKGWYEKEFAGMNVRPLPKLYPDWLCGHPKSFREKILYFLYVRILSRFTEKNLFDRAYAWRDQLLNALENVHKRNAIDVLVVTGAPFSLLDYGSEFKVRHKDIFYVSDLRDPWTWGSCYGIPEMQPGKKKFQERSEFKTMETSDMVCYPTLHMGEVLKKKYPAFSSKFYLLPHAYDPDKFSAITRKNKREGFIYGGTLYDGIGEYLANLARILKAHPGSGFKWDIYTGTPYPMMETSFSREDVRVHPLVPEEQLFQNIANSAAYLAFFPVYDKDLVSTKFFEIIYAGTPILYIGPEGEVGRFIRENRVGVHILPENMDSDLPQYLNGTVPFEPGYFEISRYSFSAVTENFLKVIEQNKIQIGDNK